MQITFEKCITNFYFKKRRSWYKNNNRQLVVLISMERFRMFMLTHFYEASFSIKTCFYATDNIFYLRKWMYFQKTIRCLRKFKKGKGQVTLGTFCNFAYFSSCLLAKTLAWKRDCAISPKLQML